jgi:cell division protein FtsL
MWYNMLARKIDYMHFQGAAPFPVDKNRYYDKTRVEERQMTHTLIKTLWVIAIVGILLVVHVALSAITTNYGYSLMQVKQNVSQLHRENETMRLDIANMQAPERIYSIATKKMGMVMPAMVLYKSPQTSNTAEKTTTR